MSQYTTPLNEYLINNIQYSERTHDSTTEMRWVALPREHPMFILEEFSQFRCRLLDEWEWRALGITMSKGWEHCGYSPFEYNILIFKRKLIIKNSEI